MARRKNTNWNLPDEKPHVEHAQLAVLMDIRDELQQLNRTLGCYRVERMSDDINRIDRRLANNGLLLYRKRRGSDDG